MSRFNPFTDEKKPSQGPTRWDAIKQLIPDAILNSKDSPYDPSADFIQTSGLGPPSSPEKAQVASLATPELAPELPPDFGAPTLDKMNPVVKKYLMDKMQRSVASNPDKSDDGPIPAADFGAPTLDKMNPAKAQEASFAEQLKAAQDRSNERQSGLGWAQFIAGAGDAIAGRSSAQTAQNFDNIRKGIQDQEVGQLKDRHLAEQMQTEEKRKNDLYDPNSRQSKVIQGTIRKLYGNKFSEEQISQITAADQDLVLKPFELNAKLEDTRATNQLKNEMMRQNQADRRDKAAGDAYQKATHDLNSFRGNTAVQQASSALTNVQNALSLANKGNLSPDQLHLFASEMGKLATNGVPGHSEIQALIPDTMKTRLAKVTQFFGNSPSDADAQAFINNNKRYLDELAHNYGDVVNKYRENVLDGYKRKLSPEDYDSLSKRYSSAAKEPEAPTSTNKPSWAK